MGTRRLLASVAEGTARAFASRNNDIDGWWALGLLLDATPPATPDYVIDLLTGGARPTGLPGSLDALGPAWATYFEWNTERHRIHRSWLRSAELTIEFNRDVPVKSWLPSGSDRELTCSVRIVDDRERVWRRAVQGHAGRLSDFTDPNPYWHPMRSGRQGPVGVLDRHELRDWTEARSSSFDLQLGPTRGHSRWRMTGE